MLGRLIYLTKKEFLVIFQDKINRALLIVMPIVMLFVFSFAITMEVKGMTLGVFNEDEGDLGARFARAFEPGETYSDVMTFRGEQEIASAVDAQRVLMVLHIPRDFSSRLMSGRSVSVQAILDGRKPNAAQIASGYAALIATRFARELAAGRVAMTIPRIETRSLFNPNLDFAWFNQPVLMVLITMMIVLLVTGMSVAKERELGTFEQLLVSPLSPIEIVAGKMIPGIVIGAAEAAFMFLLSTRFFRVPFVGSLPLLVVVMMLFIISSASIGLVISSMCATQQQAFLGNTIFMVPSMILSGFISPVENMPTVLQAVSYINPAMHTMKALVGVYLKDLSAADISVEIASMSAISVVLLLAAAWSFKSRAS